MTGGDRGLSRRWYAGDRRAHKVADDLYHFRGAIDAGEFGVFWVRIFDQRPAAPIVVLSEVVVDDSTSVTNLTEILAAEVLARYMPHRFEFDEPMIVLEHYPGCEFLDGTPRRKATWYRVLFASWRPRLVKLGTAGCLSVGSPSWQLLPEIEVEMLLGRAEIALPVPPIRMSASRG